MHHRERAVLGIGKKRRAIPKGRQCRRHPRRGQIGVNLMRCLPRLTGSGGTAPCVALWALHDRARDAEVQCTAILEELMVPEVGVEWGFVGH